MKEFYYDSFAGNMPKSVKNIRESSPKTTLVRNNSK